MDSTNLCGFRLHFADLAYKLRNPLTIYAFRLQFADSTYSCGFRDSFSLLNIYIKIRPWIPQTGSRFDTFCCEFRKFACFWSAFEQYSVLAIRPRNPKQQRKSKKNSSVAESARNLIFACSGIRLQFTKCTVWPCIVWKIVRLFAIVWWRPNLFSQKIFLTKIYYTFCLENQNKVFVHTINF